MKTKDILKRSYYALTIGLLTGALMLHHTRYSLLRHYVDVGCYMILAMGICWIMTRHNNPVHFKRYAGTLFTLTFLYVYIPRLSLGVSPALHDSIFTILFCSYWACIVISTYLSNTKYYNIFPNQSKGVSWLFRGLSWTGQIIVWGIMLIVLVCVINDIINK